MVRLRYLVAPIAVAFIALGSLAGTHVARAQTANTGQVRVVHMSPGAPNVDVLVDGKVAIQNLAFKQASPYAALPAGSHQVAVAAAGKDDQPLLTTTLPVDAGKSVTVVAVGTPDQLKLQVVQDDNTPPPSGQAKVRIFHASPDAGPVDVGVAGGPTLIQNLAFPNASNYLTVPAGTYNVQVRAAGTQNVALDLPNTKLDSGQIITVFAAGLAKDKSLTAVPVLYSGSAATAAPAQAMPASGTGGLIGTSVAAQPWLLALLGVTLLGLGTGTLAFARIRRD